MWSALPAAAVRRRRHLWPSAPPAPPLDIGGLVNAHLFGNAVVQNTGGDGANAPPSSMPLVLAGVLATEDPKEGMAIIGESAAAAKVVAVGQQVPGRRAAAFGL